MLAIVTSVFVLIASVTGIILVIEPISNQLKPYALNGSSQLSIADLTSALNAEFEEVVSVVVNDQGFVKASVFTKDGRNETFFLNPETGTPVKAQIKRAPIYDFATNLHRSLFLKSTGRFMIGLVSFLMVLIIATGIILVAKRQGGFRRWFTKEVKEDVNQYYHVLIGRYAFLPLLIIAITGVMLSMDRFSLLPDSESETTYYEINKSLEPLEAQSFQLFKDHDISELVSLEYPFSPDEEDYFILKLKDAEYHINQYNGQVLMAGQVPFLERLLAWSYLLHTGHGSLIWAFVLLFSCFALLFFMFSGLSMGLKRIKSTKKFSNIYTKDQAEYIVLVGSESGSTFRFATAFVEALVSTGTSVFLDAMNNYSSYAKAKNILVFTSTYGDGDAPSGAKYFEHRFHSVQQHHNMEYTVLGFGSRNYPEFCKYAIEADNLLASQSEFHRSIPLAKINNQSITEFRDWLQQWRLQTGVDLRINESKIVGTPKHLRGFKVVSRTPLNAEDTFVMQLKAPRPVKFRSGDLLAVYPPGDPVERLYSIGKVDGLITLSIKKHPFGLASGFLNELQVGDQLKARIKPNPNFYLPTEANQVIMISNGTGIGPFLGMIDEKAAEIEVHLLWGGRTLESLGLYDSFINAEALNSFQTSFSREEQSAYVQDLIPSNSKLFTDTLSNKGTIMVCGSVQMQKSVTAHLIQLCEDHLDKTFDFYERLGQIKMDCY